MRQHTATFVDLDGQPIDAMAWGKLFEDCKSSGGFILAETVYETPVGRVILRTAWGGLNIPGMVRPWGTASAVSSTGPWNELEEYDTQEDALVGHARWTERLASERES